MCILCGGILTSLESTTATQIPSLTQVALLVVKSNLQDISLISTLNFQLSSLGNYLKDSARALHALLCCLVVGYYSKLTKSNQNYIFAQIKSSLIC